MPEVHVYTCKICRNYKSITPGLHKFYWTRIPYRRRSAKYWGGLWSDLMIEQVLIRALQSWRGLTTGLDITKSVRQLWVESMHPCADIHNGMCNLTGLQHRSNEQHVEMGVIRKKCDNDDLRKIYRLTNIILLILIIH